MKVSELRLVSSALRSCAVGVLLAIATTLIPAHASYTWRNVQIVGGGFVPGIVFSEAEPGLVYARTDIGGCYRMDNTTGGKWVPLLDWVGWDQWGYTGVISIAPDPSNANTVFAAVGTYTNSWDPNNGAILKSVDRGATWTIAPLPFKNGGNMPGRGAGERLAIDPNNSNIVYFAAGGNATETFGLWRTTNGGSAWSKVTSFTAQGDWVEDPTYDYTAQKQGLWWVVFDKRFVSAGVTQHIYVGVATKNGPTIYRSTDAGANWSPLPGQPLADCGGNKLMPKKAKLDATHGILYIAYGYRAGPYEDNKGDLWKYNANTGAWMLISPVVNDCTPVPDGNPYFGYNGLTVDKQNPNTIMVTGYSSWWPDTFIYRSTDGGQTWTNIWEWTRYPNRSYRYEHNSSGGIKDVSAAPWLMWAAGQACASGGRPGPAPNPKVGWMTETLEIDPFNSNRMMYGTGATIYGCDDLTDWDRGLLIDLKVRAVGLEETAVQVLLSPPTGPQLVSGMYDVRGFKHDNVDVVPSTMHPTIHGSADMDFAELVPTRFVSVEKTDTENCHNGLAVSTDSGGTWTITSGVPTGTTEAGTVCYTADGGRVVWSNNVGVFHSTNPAMGNWVACSGVPAGATVRSDRVNPNKVYALHAGTFYVSTDGATSFTASATGLPSSGSFRAVFGQEGHIWLGSGAGLWRSMNSGASFTKLTTLDAADTIGFGKAAPGQAYPALYSSGAVAGVRGIYRSLDAGATWTRINDDKNQWGWTGWGITGDPRIFGRVYLTTNGRGIIYGDEGGGSTPTAPAAPSGLSAAAVSTSRIDVSWSDNANNETSQELQRATDSAFTANVVNTTLGANVTTHQVTGLTANTTYYFRVRAVNDNGASAYSNTASAKTPRR